MSLSKHQRDLPQLCSLAIFSQMDLRDRISAYQVCPEWYHRVREVNQTTVPSLTITVGGHSVKDYEFQINWTGNVLQSARLLTNSDGSPQFPMHRLTKWNCFGCAVNDQQNWIILKQIVSTFPSITELIFVCDREEKLKLLTEMLQNDHWRRQLISLKVINQKNRTHLSDPTVLQPLFTAINSLPALKYLTLRGVELYDLPILAQLKVINCMLRVSFLNSLQQYAAQNTGELSVEVSGFDRLGSYLTELSKSLSAQLRGRITCLRIFTPHIDRFPLSGIFFPNLNTLYLWVSSSTLSQLFSVLSQLHRLQQLSLSINFTDLDPEHPFPLLQAQLRSVKALDLYLYFNSHSQVNWLNLPVTMPFLGAINLFILNCRSCETKGHQANVPDNILEQNCSQDVLQILHHSTGLPLNRLSLQL